MINRRFGKLRRAVSYFVLIIMALLVPVFVFFASRLPKILFVGFVTYSLFILNKKVDTLVDQIVPKQEITQEVALVQNSPQEATNQPTENALAFLTQKQS